MSGSRCRIDAEDVGKVSCPLSGGDPGNQKISFLSGQMELHLFQPEQPQS